MVSGVGGEDSVAAEAILFAGLEDFIASAAFLFFGWEEMLSFGDVLSQEGR